MSNGLLALCLSVHVALDHGEAIDQTLERAVDGFEGILRTAVVIGLGLAQRRYVVLELIYAGVGAGRFIDDLASCLSGGALGGLDRAGVDRFELRH